MKLINTLIVFLFCLNACAEAPQKAINESQLEKPAKVTLTKTDGKYQLFVDGKPFYNMGILLLCPNTMVTLLEPGELKTDNNLV